MRWSIYCLLCSDLPLVYFRWGFELRMPGGGFTKVLRGCLNLCYCLWSVPYSLNSHSLQPAKNDNDKFKSKGFIHFIYKTVYSKIFCINQSPKLSNGRWGATTPLDFLKSNVGVKSRNQRNPRAPWKSLGKGEWSVLCMCVCRCVLGRGKGHGSYNWEVRHMTQHHQHQQHQPLLHYHSITKLTNQTNPINKSTKIFQLHHVMLSNNTR